MIPLAHCSMYNHGPSDLKTVFGPKEGEVAISRWDMNDLTFVPIKRDMISVIVAFTVTLFPTGGHQR